jgi:hypothetical protein
MPPDLVLLDHSIMSIDSLMPTAAHYGVIAGTRLENLFLSDDSIDYVKNLNP